MSGSLKWFEYQTDLGDSFGVLMDESNGEIVGNIDITSDDQVDYALPRILRPRRALYRSLDNTISRSIILSTAAQLTTVPATAVFGIEGGAIDLVLSRTVGEIRPRIIAGDTGQTDGDDS